MYFYVPRHRTVLIHPISTESSRNHTYIVCNFFSLSKLSIDLLRESEGMDVLQPITSMLGSSAFPLLQYFVFVCGQQVA